MLIIFLWKTWLYVYMVRREEHSDGLLGWTYTRVKILLVKHNLMMLVYESLPNYSVTPHPQTFDLPKPDPRSYNLECFLQVQPPIQFIKTIPAAIPE